MVDGGAERADSVLAGLQALPEAQWVLVHDAARPACIRTTSAACCRCAKPAASAGSAAPVRDTMKRAEPGKPLSPIPSTAMTCGMRSPATFPRELLVDCLTRALNEEPLSPMKPRRWYCGFHPQLVAGRADNIKVTRPEDRRWLNFTSPVPDTEKA